MNKNQNLLIKNFVHQLKNDLERINHQDSAIFFTGLTGSGKGTLIHFLKKNKKIYARMSETGDMIIDLRTPPNGTIEEITISNKMISDTSIPHQTNYKGEVYRDLPGFMDNRNEENYIPQDIINSFFIHEVYEKTENIKIVFTASKNSLNDKATQFINSLTHFAQRFQNIKQIIKSIFFVVTKVPSNLEHKHIKVSLTKIINDLKAQIPQNTKIILETWTSNEDMIELFKIPEREGPLNFNASDLIYEKIKKVPYSRSPMIRNIISENSQSKMIELEQKWNESISNICHELIKANYEQYLKKIQKIKMLNTAKSNLNYLRHKLDQLMGAEKPDQFKERLKEVPELYKNGTSSKSAQLMNEFEEYYEFLNLFRKIHPAIYNTQKWKQHLYKIHYNISQLVSEPWEQIHGPDIYIKGFVIQSSTIQKKINFHKSNHLLGKCKVVIFAYFFIMNEDISYSGGNLMIYTEYFIVEGKNLKIRLNGDNAKDYSVLTANDNTDGRPGRPGQNGGNLLIKVNQRSDNIHHLSVDLRGGRGCKGQNGGEIKLQKTNKVYVNYLMHDKDLPTKQKQYLVYRQDYKFSERNILSKLGEVLRILTTYNGQVVQFYSTEVQIQKHLNNFVYTLGGAGGKPGHSGCFHNFAGNTVVAITEPESSENGQAHVEVYEGLYAKEMVFPNFRDEGKEYNLNAMLEDKKFQQEFKRVEQEMRQKLERQKKRNMKMPNSETGSPQAKKQIQNCFFSNEEYKIMAQQLKNQLEQEYELKTPPAYFTKYKEQAEYLNDSMIIREEENQDDQNDKVSKELYDETNKGIHRKCENSVTNQLQKANYEKVNSNLNGIVKVNGRLKLARKPSVNRIIPRNSYRSINSDTESFMIGQTKSGTNKKYGSSLPQKYLTSPLLIPKKQYDSSYFEQEKKQSSPSQQFSQQLIKDFKSKAPEWGKEMGKQLATDIGTGTVEKIATKIINKIWEKALRTGLTMEKEVFKKFAETAIKNEADKKLLAEIGILTTGNLKNQIAKAVTLKSQQLIFTHFGKEVIKDTAQVMERQAFKHLGEDFLKRVGQQTVNEAEIQIAAKSLSSGTVYVEGMMEGLFKSIMFQVFLSMIMASGATDGWLIKPHFKSKKMDLKIYNDNEIHEAEKKEEFGKQEMRKTEAEYEFFHSSFKQFQAALSNKI